jgi:phosphoglycerate dehydrogenase-like enzyme
MVPELVSFWLDTRLGAGALLGAAAMYFCGPSQGSVREQRRKQQQQQQQHGGGSSLSSSSSSPRYRQPTAVAGSVCVAALLPKGSAAATKVEAAVVSAGAAFLGAEDDFDKFEDGVLARVDVLFGHGLTGEKLGRSWEKLPQLQWFQTSSAGVEHIFRGNKCPQLVESAVTMTNASGAYTQIIAEYVLGCVLFFDKELYRREKSRAARKWDKFPLHGTVSGLTMGVVGIGDIGTASARLAKAFGMRVVATRRRPERPNPFVDKMYDLQHMEEMLAECDYVCMATPYTPQTHEMIQAKHFAAMQESAVFINVGRGKCVDEPALLKALETGA